LEGIGDGICYLLPFTLALRHYEFALRNNDVAARMKKGAPGSPAAGALLGLDVRVVLLVAAALAGVATLGGEAVLAGAVGGALLIEAGLDWRTRSS
jgi:hypothetical protein